MKTKKVNKRIDEIKHGVLYMAEQLGTEQKLRKVFNKFEQSFPNSFQMSETEIRTNLAKIAISENLFFELKNAFHFFDQLPKKQLTEEESRAGIIATAKRMGVPEPQIRAIFNKYDNLLKKATSENERQQISYMGAAEIHKLLGVRGPLVMDGKTIIPAEPGYEEESSNGKFLKLD